MAGSEANGTANGGTPAEVPAEAVIDPPVYVWEKGTAYSGESVELEYTVEPSTDPAKTIPNGLIVCQEVPAGWEVERLDPPADAYDPIKRIYKWLFIGSELTNQVIVSGAFKESGTAVVGDWNKVQSWYSYRQPDGQVIEVQTIQRDP